MINDTQVNRMTQSRQRRKTGSNEQNKAGELKQGKHKKPITLTTT